MNSPADRKYITVGLHHCTFPMTEFRQADTFVLVTDLVSMQMTWTKSSSLAT